MLRFREIIKRLLGKRLTKVVGDGLSPLLSRLALLKGYLFNTWSQYGEDREIDRLLGYKTQGRYVDIGANDPNLINNTRRFYRKGWSGINCEPNVVLFQKLATFRPRDINLNCGAGPVETEMVFYRMSADILSTFNRSSAEQYEREGYKILEQVRVPVITLETIFRKLDKPADFMSLDVEGWEIEVLKSNDWNKHRPTLIVAKINQGAEPIAEYLTEIGYGIVWRNPTNAIFQDKKAITS
jgi:FkbM family methyltransferase